MPLSLGKLTYVFVPLPMMKTLFGLEMNNLYYKMILCGVSFGAHVAVPHPLSLRSRPLPASCNLIAPRVFLFLFL